MARLFQPDKTLALSPDIRKHRGPHPADKQLFSAERIVMLRTATAELSWLLTRGYQMPSSLKLVGDRYGLTARQRLAISRAACSDQAIERRKHAWVPSEAIKNENVIVDGFNLIITLEAALSGGVLLLCRDDCVRDLSGVHGSYRSVIETERVISLIDAALAALNPASVLWLLDRPISNSGRLAKKIANVATEHRRPWKVEVVFNPDAAIISSSGIAVTSDSSILDHVDRWMNLNSYLLSHYFSHAWFLDLRCRAARTESESASDHLTRRRGF